MNSLPDVVRSSQIAAFARLLCKLVKDIPVGKADGLGGIPTCLLKLSFPSIASSLTHIFNLVISKGIIPKDWKSARVTPIFKADSKVDPANRTIAR